MRPDFTILMQRKAPRWRWRAWYTSPIPPAPRSPRISYFPSRSAPGARSAGVPLTMGGVSLRSARPQRTRDEPDAAEEQHEHEQRVEETRGLKVDVEVREDADEDDHRAGDRQQP